MLVDYYIVRRGQIDVAGLYDDPATARYGDINWAAVIAALVGLVAGWSWQYGLVEFMQGPIAKATNNTDLSWLTAFVVSGGLYYVLRPILAKEEGPTAAPTAAA
jgi:cytosine/uracil/thiamine/allantoin permease